MPLCGIWVDIRALTCVCIKMQFFLLEINVMMSEGMDAAGTSVSSTSCSSSSADRPVSLGGLLPTDGLCRGVAGKCAAASELTSCLQKRQQGKKLLWVGRALHPGATDPVLSWCEQCDPGGITEPQNGRVWKGPQAIVRSNLPAKAVPCRRWHR